MMTHRRFLLVVLTLLLAAAPGARSQSPDVRLPRSDSQTIRQTTDVHEQGVRQRRSTERVETRPHDSRVEIVPPPWEYESPSDADVLGGWENLPPEGAWTGTGTGEIRLSDRAKGWQLYRRGDYGEAARLFSAAMSSDDRQEALNARLGLAYSLLKQGKRDAAIPHLRDLVDEDYRLAEVLSALIHALVQAQRWDEAQNQISRLPSKERRSWERRIAEARLLQDYKNLPAAANADALRAFLDSHGDAAEACIRPDVFHAVGSRLGELGSVRQAVDINRKLLNCDLPVDLRLGILAELTDALPDDDALILLQNQKDLLRQTAPQRLADLESLEVRTLKQRLASLPPGSASKLQTADAILNLSPDDPDALLAKAWHAFQSGEYEEAQRIFSQLSAQDPANKEYALGLGYSRLKSGRLDTALEPLDRGGFVDDAETIKLRSLVLRQQAARAYDAADYDQAAAHLEAILAINPEDPDAKEMLAWTRYHQDRHAEAESLLEEILAEQPSPGIAEGLLGLYTDAGDDDQAYDLARRLAGGPDPNLKASTAGFYFDRGAPITAAQLDRDPQRCYFNADSPRVEAFLYHRNKQGDGKFGDLQETALPITFIYPAELGKQWSAAIAPKQLNGKSGSSRPRSGRFYRSLNGAPQKQDLEDSLLVVQPELGFEMEGRLHTEVHLGTTPLNGPVDPTPTFEARLGAAEWYLEAHRCNVKDSILSYVGQKDPYSNDEWGRVTRSGVEGGKTWPLWRDWWLNGSAGFDYYMGDSVRDNQAVHLDTAFGRSLRIDKDEFSYGLFFSIQHFRRNSDFYTYGHGGYYSPELMTLLGPFARYRTAACRDYWLDVQAAIGWLHQKLDGSPFYPLFDGDTTGFSPAAAADANGRYDADTDNKIGVNLKLQGMKLITPNLAAGGFAAVNNTADYTEWMAGVGIQIFFDPQNLFWTRKDMFREFGKCSNK